jgi:hypothetical protein
MDIGLIFQCIHSKQWKCHYKSNLYYVGATITPIPTILNKYSKKSVNYFFFFFIILRYGDLKIRLGIQ